MNTVMKQIIVQKNGKKWNELIFVPSITQMMNDK